MGLLDEIREEVSRAGQSKGTFIYFREGEKRRIRFLNDFEDGMMVVFHDSYELNINVPCQSHYGRDCEYCTMDELRTRKLFAWTVWDYEEKERKLFMQAVNSCTAIPTFAALYDENGTLTDRDYVVLRNGKKQNTTYVVMAQDKNVFKNKKVKPFTEEEILECLDRAYPDKNAEPEEYSSPRKPSGTFMNKPDDEEWEEEENEKGYSSYSAPELYRMCKSRKLEVIPKKSKEYYIKQLEKWDAAQDEWVEDDEEWEEE